MADPEAISVIVDDETENVRVDPETGTVEVDQPDGGVVVQLDAHRKKDDDGENEFYKNLVDDVDPLQLGSIANDLIDAIKADDNSRQEYLAITARGLDLLGIKLQEPKSSVESSGIDGMSTVTNPLLLEAILKGWANAQAELLPSAGPVKIKDEGDETAFEDDMAETLERDMNYYLTTTAPEYYPDTSHMLLWGVYFKGSGFKKLYRCPMRRRPVSESVSSADLIVSDTAKDLRACSRITHQIMMRPSVMKRMQLLGAYKRVTLTQPTPMPNVVENQVASIQGTQPQPERPEDQPYTIWETQCELDLPEFAPKEFEGEGIPLPYIVTLDKDSQQILAIRRDWKEDDENCERKRMYVKYPYVPGPGFYGTGMLNILGNASAAMTAAWREALDAGMYANFPAGVMSKLGTRQNTSNFRLSPGDWPAIETNGLPIGQVMMALPYKDVTAGLLTLIDKITSQAKEVGGTADMPTAEGTANVPVGTMLAQIEQATKVMAAAHKGMHQAQAEEFGLLLDLFREYPEDFWRANKKGKTYWNEQKFLTALDMVQLVPVADPNIPSHIHRVGKAVALVQLFQIPAFSSLMDGKEVLLRALHAMREDPKGLVQEQAPQAAPPPPGEVAKLVAAQAKAKDAETNAGELQLKSQNYVQDGQMKAAELQSKEKISENQLKAETIIHAHDSEKAQAAEDRAHGLAQQQHGLEVAKHLHEVGTANQGVGAPGLDVARHVHQVNKDAGDHALEAARIAQDERQSQRDHAISEAELAIKNKIANKPVPTKPKGKTK